MKYNFAKWKCVRIVAIESYDNNEDNFFLMKLNFNKIVCSGWENKCAYSENICVYRIMEFEN